MSDAIGYSHHAKRHDDTSQAVCFGLQNAAGFISRIEHGTEHASLNSTEHASSNNCHHTIVILASASVV